MVTIHSQFYKPDTNEQQTNQIVDVTQWSLGDLSPYAEGTRDKFLIYAPNQTAYPFLLPGHKYLLKKTYVEKSGTILFEQFWNEIIAYKLGRTLNIRVPPAFIACYKSDDIPLFYGCLIEWFYDYEGEEKDTSLRGGDIITRYIENYDEKKGEQHNFQTVTQIFEDEKVENWIEDWAEILLFDAIIGNTDRHHDNWQIIEYKAKEKKRCSPAFDNGTSLSYRIRNEHIDIRPQQLEKRVRHGYHHMRWQQGDLKQAHHFELLQNIISRFPEARGVYQRILNNILQPAYDDIMSLTKFALEDPRYQLSEKRAEFIIEQIKFRINYAKKVLDL